MFRHGTGDPKLVNVDYKGLTGQQGCDRTLRDDPAKRDHAQWAAARR
jgi:hypothetical protein